MSLRKITALVVVLSVLFSAGCFQMYQQIKLKADLSGTISLRVIYDMEKVLDAVVKMQLGEDADEEMVAAAKEQMRGQMKEKSKKSTGMLTEEEINNRLPKGIKLVKMKVKEDGLKVDMKIVFAFDHISSIKKLKDLDLSQAKQKMGNNPMKNPFGGLEIKEDGKFVIISTVMKNNPTDMKKMKGVPPGMDALIKPALQSMSINYKVKPSKKFKIVKHNATKQKKGSLYWIYDYQTLVKSGKKPSGMYVKLQKK